MSRNGGQAILPVVLALVMACAQPTSTTPPPVQQPAQSNLPTVTFPDGYVVHVEVVADDESRSQGLMFRDRLREGTGMLFLFRESGDLSFWMKNTLIPLDMIWIDENQKVVHVKSNVPPCKADPCPSYSPGVNARNVLEVAAGVAAQHRIEAGAQLKIAGTDNVQIR